MIECSTLPRSKLKHSSSATLKVCYVMCSFQSGVCWAGRRNVCAYGVYVITVCMCLRCVCVCIRCAYGVYVHTVCLRCACAYGVHVHTVCSRCACAYGVCAYGVLTVLVVHRQAQECGSQTGTGSWLTDRYMAHYGV